MPKHESEIVGGHLHHVGQPETVLRGHTGHRFEVSHAPGWIGSSQLLIESLVARSGVSPVTAIRAIQYQNAARTEQVPGTGYKVRRRFPGAMWIMLMQTTASAC